VTQARKRHTGDWVFLLLRILLGLVFLFSSFVKGVDPLGTSYKVEDYLMVFGWNGLIPYALVLSYGLILLEFLLGVALLFKAFLKYTYWVMLLVMAFFTVLTYFDATKNLVSDCGCFGDALKITNWQTFYKNIVLMVMLLVLMLGQFRFHFKSIKVRTGGLVLFFAAVVFVSFMNYNINHLPVIDFRPWKVGQVFHGDQQNKKKIFVSYRNKKTGEVKEFLFPNYPWQDSTWMKQWTFVGQRIVENKGEESPQLVIQDSLGNDRFQDIFASSRFHFVLVSYNMNQAELVGFQKFEKVNSFISKQNIPVVMLTASDRGMTKDILQRYQLNFPVYFADEITLKAMIRSNPGLILLHNGRLIRKWAFRDFPSEEQLKKILAEAK